ncbi:hypothetical protein [Aeoliella mucimassa]|uniref:hypothetical protein n=1 Tax=Aeoliella mucimassa TaxID=2527972 RepID=UPI0011A3008E|nr:hypothetical protein [Aeoliella mucimassa]
MRSQKCRYIPGKWALAAVVTVAFALAGCQGGNGVTLSGKVTLDGQDVPNGRISFVPLGAGPTASARIEAGKYEVLISEVPLPANYLVRVSSMQPTGIMIKHPDAEGGQLAEEKEVIPAKYNTNSELTIELTSSMEPTWDIELTTDK